MLRKPSIRIRSSDKGEYQKLVKNVKSKIRRTQKNYGVDLNSEINIPKLSDFTTREEFNQFRQQARSFTNRSNLHYQFQQSDFGVTATKAEIQRGERLNRRSQKNAKELIKRAEKKPYFNRGKKEGTVGQQMQMMQYPNQAVGVNVPKNFNFKNVKSRKDFDLMIKSIEKRAKPEHYSEKMAQAQRNFVTKIKQSFHSDADELAERILQMSPDDFWDMYNQYSEFDFEEYESDFQPQGDGGKIDQMMANMDRYYGDNDSQDLKNF